MEDIEIKKAYMIVIKDMEKICHTHGTCSECEIVEACDQASGQLYEIVAKAKELVFGKEEEND